jgi:hypothetical protein
LITSYPDGEAPPEELARGSNEDEMFSTGLKLPAAKVRLERTEPMTVFTAAEASNERARARIKNFAT